MYHRVIVPIEEGATAESLAFVRPLARDLDCALTLLHVHHLQEAAPELEGFTQYRFQHVVEAWDGRDHDAESREETWLAAMASEFSRLEPGLRVSSRVVHAPLGRSLHDEAERLLVVASVDEELAAPGPAAQELIRRGGVPVLLVRPGRPMTPIRRILVPLDGSQFSLEVLDPVVALARATRARVTLLQAVSRHGGLIRLLHPGEGGLESAERFLRRVGDRLAEALGPAEVRVVESEDPSSAIIGEVEREGFDLVAMATHGRGGLRKLLLGSVAERVVRESAVPVMVYRPLGSVAAPEPRKSDEGAVAR